MVALDISKVLNQGDKIFVAANESQLRTSINRMMDRFIEQNSQVWENIYRRRDRKIIGTVIRFSFMSTVESINTLVHTSQWALNPRLGIKPGDEQILRELVAALDAPST